MVCGGVRKGGGSDARALEWWMRAAPSGSGRMRAGTWRSGLWRSQTYAAFCVKNSATVISRTFFGSFWIMTMYSLRMFLAWRSASLCSAWHRDSTTHPRQSLDPPTPLRSCASAGSLIVQMLGQKRTCRWAFDPVSLPTEPLAHTWGLRSAGPPATFQVQPPPSPGWNAHAQAGRWRLRALVKADQECRKLAMPGSIRGRSARRAERVQLIAAKPPSHLSL